MGISIAISAGEASGDLNGSYLALELKRLRQDLQIWGAGGNRMREAGVDVVVNMAGCGTIGIAETLRAAPGIFARYFQLRSELIKRKPDLFVPIDFGAFNVRLATIAHRIGIPVVYYFPPSSWRKRPRNSQKLLDCGGRVITPFPWSAELLCQGGVDARFVGHPLIDIVKPTVSRENFALELGLESSQPMIGLLPGSRSHEIREHLLPMLDCAEIISNKLEGAQFVVGAAWGSEDLKLRIEEHFRGKNQVPRIEVVERRTYDCMASSDLLITASGTATLEAAILGTPMVIIYRGSAIMRFEFLFRKSVLEEFIGMPNIIADRGICPELINDDVTPEKIAAIALGIITSEERNAKMRADLKSVRSQLGESGAVKRAAELLLAAIGG